MAAAAARRGARYGKDFKQFTITMSLEEHKLCKQKALEFDVPVTEVCRVALLDQSNYAWKRAVEVKAQQQQEKEGEE